MRARQAARRFANRLADRFFANIGRSNLSFLNSFDAATLFGSQ
jgi:hypothetical protein